MLKVQTAVYKISADGTRSLVPSEASPSGGGYNDATEWVVFYVNIPLSPAKRNAEIRRILSKVERFTVEQQFSSEQDRLHAEEKIRRLQKHPQSLAEIISQYRVGRFQVDCRVLDEDRVIGLGRVDLEVLFKGRFSDRFSDSALEKK